MARYRRASEINEWVYCHRAWWLHHVQGYEPGNVAARAAGTQAHATHGATLGLARTVRRLALLVALAGTLALAGWWLGWW